MFQFCFRSKCFLLLFILCKWFIEKCNLICLFFFFLSHSFNRILVNQSYSVSVEMLHIFNSNRKTKKKKQNITSLIWMMRSVGHLSQIQIGWFIQCVTPSWLFSFFSSYTILTLLISCLVPTYKRLITHFSWIRCYLTLDAQPW